jgi:hypothetical protein
MIYATIPSKYLLDELTEMLRDLKMLYISLMNLAHIRDLFSEELLKCENDGDAYEIGRFINIFSTNIKNVKHNAHTITRIICEAENITLEECTNRMENLIGEETLNGEDVLEMPNEIGRVLMNKLSKRYPQCIINSLEQDVDGSCTDY